MIEAEREYEMTSAVIKASEEWAKGYADVPENHAKLIKQESKLERMLLTYFRDLATRIEYFVDWYGYENKRLQVQAADNFSVDVLLNEVALANEDGILFKVIYDPLATAVYLGVNSGEELYKLSLGITPSSEMIQQAAKELAAELVGKKVDKQGIVTSNPKAKYRISDKTRADIRQSISTSLSLGEDRATTIRRLQKTIKNPKRAQLIAETETVNAYQTGIYGFGKASGAVGKQWQSVGAIDICAEFARYGIVELNYEYELPSGRKIKHPTAHPRCRCDVRLVYPEELE